MLRPGPAAVVVVVADGYGVLSAQQAWHFVVESPELIQLVMVPVWFPIAAGLTTPVPELEEHVPVFGGPHRRLEASDLPVPQVTLERPARKKEVPADRWVRARPGVRVDERPEPDLPDGYLHLDRLSQEAVAWCALDGRFGLVEWAGPRIYSWSAELDDPVQVLRAGGDVIAIATDSEVRCFDAGSGQLLWVDSLRKKRWQLLDATRDVMIASDGELVIASSSERGELWSFRTASGPVAARVSCEQLLVSEPGTVRILALESGEEQWRGKAFGELVVADGHLLVPGSGRTSLVYSLRELVASKLKTSAALARPAAPRVRILEGTLVATVTGAGGVAFLDLARIVEADVAAHVSRPVEKAWLAGSFLITTPPLSVSHLWGGIATPIPLEVDRATGALETGPAQALVRSAERTAWLEFS
jgi:hypothetical protein